jgi:tetratricopeptide (TPR) repeat protein
MVHRDIKPQNLMRTRQGIVKILDFGLASLAESPSLFHDSIEPTSSNLTADGSLLGTPDFISPEQATDAKQADIRSDIYSLGATLYFLLCGHPPFEKGTIAQKLQSHSEVRPEPIQQHRVEVPLALSNIIDRMLEKDPNARYHVPQEVATALAAIQQPTSSLQPKIKQDSVVRTGNFWWNRTVIVLAVIALLGVGIFGIFTISTDTGTLVVEAIDEKVKIEIWKIPVASRKEDIKLQFVDTISGSEIVRLPSGEYKVSLSDKSLDYAMSDGGFTLRRGEKTILKVTHKASTKVIAEAPELTPISLSDQEQSGLTSKGRKLTDDQAKELQRKIDQDPLDDSSRLQLLGFYFSKTIYQKDYRKPQLDIILWLIGKYPESRIAGTPDASIHAIIDPTGYAEAKKRWLTTVETHSKNPKVLSNAAHFFIQADRQLSEELLKKAQALDPNDAKLHSQLGQLYNLEMIGQSNQNRVGELAAKALSEFERANELHSDPITASHDLPRLASAAFKVGKLDKAKEYATRMVDKQGDSTDWNTGNKVHHGNTILGRIAIKEDNLDKACEHLLASGKTTGSPQLNSFGPSMILAKELLEKGKRDAVLEYLDLCKKFWTNEKLDQWSDAIKRGVIPDFGLERLQ